MLKHQDPGGRSRKHFQMMLKKSLNQFGHQNISPQLSRSKNMCINVDAILGNIHDFVYTDHMERDIKIKRRMWDSMHSTLEIACTKDMFIYERSKRFKVGCQCCGEDTISTSFTSISDVFKILPFLAVTHCLVEPLCAYIRDRRALSYKH